MAEVLVLVEHSEGAVKKVTTELLTAVKTNYNIATGKTNLFLVGAYSTAVPRLGARFGCWARTTCC